MEEIPVEKLRLIRYSEDDVRFAIQLQGSINDAQSAVRGFARRTETDGVGPEGFTGDARPPVSTPTIFNKGGDIRKEAFIKGVDGQPRRIERRVTQSDISKFIGREPSPFVKRRESTLLKDKFRAESRGARRAFYTTKRSIKEVQQEAIEYAKLMLPTKERGKLISAIRDAQGEKGLRRAIQQTNKVVENMNRRDWIQDIRKSVEKLHIVVFDEPVDFVEERGNFLHFIDDDEARMAPEPVTQIRRAGGICCVDIGVEEVNHRCIRQVISDPVRFADFPRSPEECRPISREIQLKYSPDNFSHDTILS